MPELPEVESTARYLRERVQGEKIVSLRVNWARTIATHTATELKTALLGRSITDVTRRGKFLIFTLTPGTEILYAHMRMSGSFDVLSKEIPPEKHDRVTIELSSGQEIRFNDPRKFARMYLSRVPGAVTGKLGIEPFDKEFTAERLHTILRTHRGRLKSLLLRQDLIAGLGNIYVDESLWYARLHPTRSSQTLKAKDSALLHKGILEILSEAIARSGTDFGDGVVHAGAYEPRVYGRAGEACSRCEGSIRRIVVGQRGTHLCLTCQRKPRS